MIVNDLESIKTAVANIQKSGHGEVVIKIKNGAVYRILTMYDILIDRQCNSVEKE